jgi:hypothetical protein
VVNVDLVIARGGVDEEFLGVGVVAHIQSPDTGAGVAWEKFFMRGERVADVAPVDEVAAVDDGNAGLPAEGGAAGVVVVADADNTGVGPVAGEDGVLEELRVEG